MSQPNNARSGAPRPALEDDDDDVPSFIAILSEQGTLPPRPAPAPAPTAASVYAPATGAVEGAFTAPAVTRAFSALSDADYTSSPTYGNKNGHLHAYGSPGGRNAAGAAAGDRKSVV